MFPKKTSTFRVNQNPCIMKTKITQLLFLMMPILTFSHNGIPKTPSQVVDMLKKNINCEWSDKTVDTFKAGNPHTPLKGIAVCMFADMETLRKAVEAECNFIIAHEPVFYNHADDTSSMANDPVNFSTY